jgi:small subunit ribosomal protein S18
VAGKKQQPRAKAKDTRKPRKKKVSPIVKDSIEYVDYKDVNLLKAFLSDRAKIRGSRVSGNNRQQQRQAAGAIKIAREMALLPYHMRVVTQRKGDKRGGGGGRGRDREDRDRGFEPEANDCFFVDDKNAQKTDGATSDAVEVVTEETTQEEATE